MKKFKLCKNQKENFWQFDCEEAKTEKSRKIFQFFSWTTNSKMLDGAMVDQKIFVYNAARDNNLAALKVSNIHSSFLISQRCQSRVCFCKRFSQILIVCYYYWMLSVNGNDSIYFYFELDLFCLIFVFNILCARLWRKEKSNDYKESTEWVSLFQEKIISMRDLNRSSKLFEIYFLSSSDFNFIVSHQFLVWRINVSTRCRSICHSYAYNDTKQKKNKSNSVVVNSETSMRIYVGVLSQMANRDRVFVYLKL